MAAALVGAVLLAGSGSRTVAAQAAVNRPAFYTEKVRPLLQTNCGKCHFDVNHKGGLSLQTKATTMKGGRSGAAIVPGDPENSLLVKLIRHEGPANDPKPMPSKAPKMSDADIATIEQWVKAGAVMPNDPATAP
jgi:mono/diheme cytochrome c family protein